METIFDHNITEEELSELGISSEGRDDYEELLTPHAAFSDIADLYFLRGDESAGKKYKKLAEKEPIAGLNDYLDFSE